MSFPIAERREGITVEKAAYTVIRKGNEAVEIDPHGKYCPLCGRDHYLENSTRCRKRDRFVSNGLTTWQQVSASWACLERACRRQAVRASSGGLRCFGAATG